MLILYELCLWIYVIGYFPVLLLRKKWHKGFVERFGFFSKETLEALGRSENIWIHAVSVGEVIAVSGLIRQLALKFPQRRIVLTTSTQTGYELAAQKLSGDVLLLWAPMDFYCSVKSFIRAVKPKLYVAAETELWPNLFYHLNRLKVPVIVVNGRISDKSYPKYLRIRWFLKRFLKCVSVFCMQSPTDVERITAIGAPPEKVKNSGNVKFDDLPGPQAGAAPDFGFKPDDLLWVAGSTHPGEEEIVLEIFQGLKPRFERLRLIIAPRHVERAPEIERLIRSQGFGCVLFSQMRSKPLDASAVILIDTIGQLRMVYSWAAMVFVGKSLTVPGGHNIIEPAFFAKPVIVGPHMQNFRDVMQAFVKNDAVVEVRDAAGLSKAVERLLGDTAYRLEIGRRARDVIVHEQGATKRIVEEINRWTQTP